MAATTTVFAFPPRLAVFSFVSLPFGSVLCLHIRSSVYSFVGTDWFHHTRCMQTPTHGRTMLRQLAMRIIDTGL